MADDSLRALRELLREREETLTFADLSEPLLEDLALGWHKGVPFAAHVAVLLSRIDGLQTPHRERELVGRALLTLLERRRAGVVPRTRGEGVRLLGSPEEDTGDQEAVEAWDRREREYQALSGLSAEYTPADFAADTAGAFAASRDAAAAARGRALPPDTVCAEHPFALAGLRLPVGMRAWFHERYAATKGAQGADVRAWTFLLAGRTLTRHREQLVSGGHLDGQGTAVPQRLLEAVLATDLGELARTAVLEP